MAQSLVLLVWLLKKRYGFMRATGVTRRCLSGGMSPRGARPHPKVVRGGQEMRPSPRAFAGGLGAVGGAELGQDVGDVLLDGVERDDQVAGDALVGAACGEQAQYFQLAVGE